MKFEIHFNISTNKYFVALYNGDRYIGFFSPLKLRIDGNTLYLHDGLHFSPSGTFHLIKGDTVINNGVEVWKYKGEDNK